MILLMYFSVTAAAIMCVLVAATFSGGDPCCCSEDLCCPGEPDRNADLPAWMVGVVATAAGDVPRVSTRWDRRDRLGTIIVRLGIRRMNYSVEPGLYAVGEPDAESPVFVTANYKKSFDHLRRDLDGYDGWVLVLDTGGINVWCAAGEGTFGTEELVQRIEATGLEKVVSHRELIVPQLGAPGVAAHEVRRDSSFRVIYGPVRSEDLPEYLDAGREAGDEMREVRFSLPDRLVLTPVEVVGGAKYVAGLLVVLVGLGGIGGGFSPAALAGSVPAALGICALGLLTGAVLTPALLPWLPGRAFSAKGAVAGLAMGAAAGLLYWNAGGGPAGAVSALLLVAVIASVFGMNFTGASTCTSLSGVRKEMRMAVPAQVAVGLCGLVLWTLA